MKPDELVKRLQNAVPAQLKSVILYGSAAAGDHLPGFSDYNVLVVLDPLGVTELRAVAKTARGWAGAGNRPPLLFTPQELRRSADAFPIEILDMQQWHRVLYGEDVLSGLEVNREHLSLELERELKGRILQLRERSLNDAEKPAALASLVADTFSTFLVLFRAALRLYQPEVPADKMEALKALAGHIRFDPQVFHTVQQIRERKTRIKGLAAQELFAAFLSRIEQISDAIDRRLHEEADG